MADQQWASSISTQLNYVFTNVLLSQIVRLGNLMLAC